MPELENRDERTLAAIMFTDMVGYSALMQKDPALTLELLAEHHALLRPILLRHLGREVKTIGDAFMVEFASAVDAVRCAIDMQTALASRNIEGNSKHRIVIRIGIHLGDVVRRENDIFGDGVNIAARIEPLAPPGGICISEDVYNQVVNRVIASYVCLGQGALKNITRPVTVYRVDLAGQTGPVLLPRLRFALARSKKSWAFAKYAAVAVVVALAAWLGATRFAGRAVVKTVTVAVADAINLTGEAAFEGISGQLITSLEQSKFVVPLTRGRMLDLLHQNGQPDVARIDEKIARQLARTNATANLVALVTLRKAAETYSLELEVLEPESTNRVFSAKEEGQGRSSVPALIDRLSARMRERFKEARAQIAADNVTLSKATTGDVEAYRHYFLGEQHLNAMRVREARTEFEAALALDPSFALAWYRLAYVKGGWELQDVAVELERAFALQERLPPKERDALDVRKAINDGRIEEAESLLKRMVARYPTDKEAWFHLGDVHQHRARYALGLAAFDSALRIDPFFESALDHAVRAKIGLKDREGMLRAAERFVTNARGQMAYVSLAYARLARGELEPALAAFRQADEASTAASRASPAHPSRPGFQGMAAVRLFQSDPAGARKIYGELTRTADPLLQYEGFKGMAATAVLEGRLKHAFEELDRAAKVAEGDPTKQAYLAAYRSFLLADQVRDLGEADTWLRRTLDSKADYWVADFYATRAAMALGDVTRAPAPKLKTAAASFLLFAEADRLTRDGRHTETATLFDLASASTDMPGGFLDLQLAAYAAAGDNAHTLETASHIHAFTYQRSPDYPMLWVHLHTRALLLGARAHELAGDKAKAARELRKLLDLWKDADGDLVDVRAAKGMRERLSH